MISPTRRARDLRRDATPAERRLWRCLRDRGVAGAKFRRQQPVGRHIVDFLCEEARLIVELDGGQHAARADADSARTLALERFGYCVLRFWNSEIEESLEGVLDAIAAEIEKGRKA